MGNRCENINSAIVVDLDKTLVKVNTFRHFIVMAVKASIVRLHFAPLLLIVAAIGCRLLRIYSHSDMKRQILSATAGFVTELDLAHFAAKMAVSANTEVLKIISQAHENREKVILATAAPEIYAQKIAMLTGCDTCIATALPSQCTDWNECAREHKLVAVKAYTDSCNLHISGLITDHFDDIPLMAECSPKGGAIFLVSPGKRTLEQIAEAGITSYSIIK